MLFPKNNERSFWLNDFIFLLLGIGIFYSLFLGSHALFTPDEGRYSEVAREMVVSGDYITPRLNGVAFLDKPILYYWLQASAIKLFGLKEWSLRLWPMLIGILGCLITYMTGRQLFNRRVGLVAACILATSPLYYAGAHYANLDLEVAVFVSATLCFFITALAFDGRKQSLFFLVGYIFAALATLTKGLMGIAFPVLIFGIWIVITNQWYLLRKMHIFKGAIVFTLIVIPWFFLVQKANPQFFHFFFITQQISRFLTLAEFNNKTYFWFYIPIIIFGFFPWSLFFIQATRQSIKKVSQNFKTQKSLLFLLIWVLTIFIFFSIPRSKTIGYIIPIFPAMALLTAYYFDVMWDKTIIKYRLHSLFKFIFIFSLTSLLILISTVNIINHKSIKPISQTIQPLIQPQDEIVTYYRYYQDLPIYLQKRITIVADWNASDIGQNDNWVRELWFGMPFQNTKEWLIDKKEFWTRWHSNRRLFVVTHPDYLKDFTNNKTIHYYTIAEYGNVVVLSNKK